MPSATSILIAHSKELIRAGLRSMLDTASIRIVGEAVNAANALTLARKHKPDVLLVDVAVPGGDAFELLKKLRKTLPGTRSIVLSAMDNPTYMARAFACGASNFLLMSVSARELATAIHDAAAGKRALGTGAYGKVTASMAAKGSAVTQQAQLTPRESQVLSHIALGLSNAEIAQSLEISVETVKEHVQNLLRKLGMGDRTQAAVWAVKSGVIGV